MSTKTKKRFNQLDALIIAFVVILIMVIGFKVASSTSLIEYAAPSQVSNVEFVIKISSIRDNTANAIPENSVLTMFEEGKNVAQIVEKKIEPAQAEITTSKGNVEIVDVPERYDVYLKCTGNGFQKDDGFYLEGTTPVYVGSNRLYKSGPIVFQAEVVEIKA